MVSAAAPKLIVLTFTEPITHGAVASSDFRVSLGAAAANVTAIALDGGAVKISLWGPVGAGAGVRVVYTKNGAAAVQNIAASNISNTHEPASPNGHLHKLLTRRLPPSSGGSASMSCADAAPLVSPWRQAC